MIEILNADDRNLQLIKQQITQTTAQSMLDLKLR